MDKMMQDFVNVMKALSDPSRVGIVMLLQQREMCACEIIPRLGLAQPTVSRHLKILMDAGLIQGRKKGVWVHYRLSDNTGKPYIAELLERLPKWIGQCPEVRELVRDIPKDNPCRNGDAAKGMPSAPR